MPLSLTFCTRGPTWSALVVHSTARIAGDVAASRVLDSFEILTVGPPAGLITTTGGVASGAADGNFGPSRPLRVLGLRRRGRGSQARSAAERRPREIRLRMSIHSW